MFPFPPRRNTVFEDFFRRMSGAPAPTPPPATSPYPLYNQFLTDIAPLVRGKLAEENKRRIREEQFRMNPDMYGVRGIRDRGGEEIIDLTKTGARNAPLNVQYAGMDEYQRALIGLREKELAQKGSLAEQGLDLQSRKVDISQQRADVYEFKAKNPNLKIQDNKAGKIQAINPQTGEVVREWDSGSLSEKDKIELTQQGKIAAIQETGKETRENIGARGEQERQNITARGEEQTRLTELKHQLERELIALRGDQSVRAIERRAELQRDLDVLREQDRLSRPNVPSQEKTNIQIKYNKLVNMKPEYGDYLKLDYDGMPEVDEDTPEDIRNEIMAYLYGKDWKEKSEPDGKKEEVKEEPPPKGAKPGGKWQVTKSGRRVYMEP